MGRKKKVNNQLTFMLNGTGALQSVVEHEYDVWKSDGKVRLLSNNIVEFDLKLKEKFCEVQDYLYSEYRKELEEAKVKNSKKDETEEEKVKRIAREKAAYHRLRLLQSLPLEYKIDRTIRTLEAAKNKYGIEGLVLAYSGGRDSEVLSHLIANHWGYKIPHIFANTTCEFPETLMRVKEKVEEEDIDLIMVYPEYTFKQVVEKYGYPMISKNISKSIRIYNRTKSKETAYTIKDYMKRKEKKWVNALGCPFSDECCAKLKKEPMRKVQRALGYECALVGTMASESRQRTKEWADSGCNAFDITEPKSMPLSIWTSKDIDEYIEKYVVKINKLYSMGYSRNGCMYCGFGKHLEDVNRLKLMEKTHPIPRGVFMRNFAIYFDMMLERGYSGFAY